MHYVAETVFVEEGAAAADFEPEASSGIAPVPEHIRAVTRVPGAFHIGSQPVAEFSGHVLVVFISVFVYIKFPAYAAVVGTFAACAVEAVVKIGYA